MLAGLVTGLFTTRCGIPAILAGILTQLALYSVNLRFKAISRLKPISTPPSAMASMNRYA